MLQADAWGLATSGAVFVAAALVIAVCGVLLLGMLRRQAHGPGNIGFEGVLVLALYGLSVLVLFSGGP